MSVRSDKQSMLPQTTGAGYSLLMYSGWATHNIGDIGHTPGTLRYLTQHFPELYVSCWLKRSNDTVLEMLRQRFPSVTFVEGTLDAEGVASTPELQRAFDAADLFLYNSGMHFTRFWAPPVSILNACLAQGKPFGLYGQSFDGFRDQDAATLPALLSKAAFIFCRDTESLQFLRRVGVAPDVLEFGPDGCFGIDVRDEAKAEAFLAEHGLSSRQFLTVTLRTDKEISVNPGEKEQSSPETIGPEEWAAKLRDIIIAWVRRTGHKVVLVPEVEKEIAPARQLIWERLPDDIRPLVVHRDSFWNVDEAASLYAQAHTVLSVEPHSCIIALANGTPAIHFFTNKHGYKAWMFRDIGLSEWLIDIDQESAERVTAALVRIENHYELAQAKVQRAMDFVNARSAEMMSDVARVLPIEEPQPLKHSRH
jgi:polysaccharide pyruvyl transferase WcaK-like protein